MQKLRPRSPYEKLGGYVHLPRLIDKARLHRKGLLNGYNYKTVGFDKHLLAFLKLNGDDFEEIANRFDNDAEVLSWVDQEWNETFARCDRTLEPGNDLAASRYRRQTRPIYSFPERSRRRRSRRYQDLFRPDRVRRGTAEMTKHE